MAVAAVGRTDLFRWLHACRRRLTAGTPAIRWSMMLALLGPSVVASAGPLPAAGIEPPKQTNLSPRSAPPATVDGLIASLARIGSGGPRTFGTSAGNLPPQLNDEIIWSPDGRMVAVLTHRADLERNLNEFTLNLFKAEDLLMSSKREEIARLSSSSVRPAIENVRWMNSHALAFLGERPNELHQVFTVDIRSRNLSRRTEAALSIRSFDISSDGSVIVYATDGMLDATRQKARKEKGFTLPEDASLPILLAGKYDDPSITSKKAIELWVARTGMAPTRYDPPCRNFGVLPTDEVRPNGFVVSPMGDRLLLRCRPKVPPVEWRRYRDGRGSFNADQAQQWLAVDLQTMQASPLMNAPIPPSGEHTYYGFGPTYDGKIFWSPDGKSVVVANAWLPVGKIPSKEIAQPASKLFSVEVDLASGAMTLVTALDENQSWTRVLFWDQTTNAITLEQPQRTTFRKVAGSWVPTPGENAPPILAIEQGLNIPPRVVATDPMTGRKATVFDPTPDLFAKQRFGAVTLLKEWDLGGGRKKYATLYWPPNYVRGKRYPVVFQGHGGTKNEFWPVGSLQSRRHAAQPLANAGIFVVQYSEGAPGWDQANFDTYGPTFAQLEGLIDLLDRSGLIDRSLVGLSGFSTDYAFFLHFMTQSRYPIAAATLGEGVSYSYFDYLFKVVGSPWRAAEGVNGGLPWGAGRATWLDRAPGFTLDRITAAVQFEACMAEEGDFPGQNITMLPAVWEHYSGLRLLGRPTELVLLPEAQHAHLNKPWMTFKSQQSAVDWFRFWLQGQERTQACDPCQESSTELGEQYKRWRAMRDRLRN